MEDPLTWSPSHRECLYREGPSPLGGTPGDVQLIQSDFSSSESIYLGLYLCLQTPHSCGASWMALGAFGVAELWFTCLVVFFIQNEQEKILYF